MKRLLFVIMVASLMLFCLADRVQAEDPPEYLTEWRAAPWPLGLCVDKLGQIWVTYYGSNEIQCFTNSGSIVSTYSVPWYKPYGIAVDEYIYFGTDGVNVGTNNCSEPGQFCSFGPGFDKPHGVAIDTTGNIYITEVYGWTYKYSPAGTLVNSWPISGQDICIDSHGNLFVLVYGNGNVRKYSPDGTLLLAWSTGPNFPEGMGMDVQGNIYVADTENAQIKIFDSEGNFLTKWGSYGSGPGQFRRPEDVAVDATGCIYVSDADNGRIQKFGSPPTSVQPTTWGRIKSLFR